MDDVFDVEKLRRNWSRAQPEQVQEISPALADVDPARDPQTEFAEAFARVQALALERFPVEQEAIRALLTEILTATAQLRSKDNTAQGEADKEKESVESPQEPPETSAPEHESTAELVADEALENDAPGMEAEDGGDGDNDTGPADEAPGNKQAMHQAIDALEELLEAFTLMQGSGR